MGRYFGHFDWITTLLLFCLAVFGLFILLSISPSLFAQQLLFLVVGFVLLVFFSLLDPILLRWFAPVGYVISCILLLVTHFGPAIRGASRWIFIGSAQLQPSEVAKPLLLLAFAWCIDRYPPRDLRNIMIHLLFFGIPFLLVFTQPDLGSSLVYGGFWLAMMVAGGLPVTLVGGCVAAGAALSPLLWRLLQEYQRSRILTFLNPALDPKGAGYNAMQAMIAVGSGQLFGRGLGLGTQSHLRFLPEFHTDFIFATLIEEFGFIGGAVLLFCYLLLLIRIVMSLRGQQSSLFVFVYAFGLFTMLLTQIFINAGMNMGLIPITGITLPLVSYGGSSILSVAISFGILWALKHHETDRGNVAFG